MSIKFFNLFWVGAVYLFLSVNAHAVTLDVFRFKLKAQTSVEKLVGKDNILGNGKIIFRDGAGSLDLEPLFDYAAFIFVVPLKEGVLPAENLKLGYRLMLNGFEDLILLSESENGNILISTPGAGIATLDSSASKIEIENLVNNISQQFSAGEFELLEAIGVLIFKVPFLETTAVFKQLEKTKFVDAVELDYENYRIPFEFDPIVVVNDAGKIDADKYRQMAKKLKEQGLRFTTETSIPVDLQ